MLAAFPLFKIHKQEVVTYFQVMLMRARSDLDGSDDLITLSVAQESTTSLLCSSFVLGPLKDRAVC